MQVPRLINDYIVYDELTNGGIISNNNSILAYSNSKIVRSTLPTSNDFYTLIQNNNVISYSYVKDIHATYKYVSRTHLIKNVINILCISSEIGSNI